MSRPTGAGVAVATTRAAPQPLPPPEQRHSRLRRRIDRARAGYIDPVRRRILAATDWVGSHIERHGLRWADRAEVRQETWWRLGLYGPALAVFAFVTAMAAAGALIFLEGWLLPDGFSLDLTKIPTVAAYALICVAITVLELGILAFLTFRAASAAAGHARHLSPHIDDEFVAKTIRASLGLGEHRMLAKDYGVRLSVRQKMAALAIAAAWNLRKPMSKSVARFLVGRLAARSALRTYSAMVAAPLIGITAGLAMFGSIRDLRRRITGRMAIGTLIDWFDPDRLQPGAELISIVVDICHLRMRTVGTADVNIVHLCRHLSDADEDVTHWHPRRFTWHSLREAIERLPPTEAEFARTATTIVMALHGRSPNRLERLWLTEMGVEAITVSSLRRILLRSRLSNVVPDIEAALGT